MGDYIARIRAELTGFEDIEAKFNGFVNKPHKIKLEVDSNGVKNNLRQQEKDAQAMQKRMASNQSAYWNQTFKNTTGSIGKKSPELQQMATYYKQQEKDAQAIAQSQSKMTDVQNRLTSAKMQNRYDSYKDVGMSTKELDSAYTSAKKLEAELTSLNSKRSKSGSLDQTDALRQVDAQKELAESYKLVGKELDVVQTKYGKATTLQDRKNLFNDMGTWAKENSKAIKIFGADIEKLQAQSLEANTSFDKNRIQSEFQGIKKDASAQGLLGRSPVDELKNMFGKFGGWFSVASISMAGAQQIKKMGQSVLEVDNALTDLKMATGVNDGQAKDLMKTYSQMGKTLKATGTDVSASATEWLKQGKSIETSNKLAKDSTVLSKIGKLSSEDSTKYLTSAAKGYKVSDDNVLGIVDKISAVDLASATDVGGLAEGMSVVAANADNAGVSMDRLLGYLATVGEVTQAGMSSVGTSFNAIFSRMGNIKLSRLDDYQNDGEDLSNVETVLKGEGLKLRDQEGEFRNFGTVLDETAGKWESFSSVSKRAVASAFAGTHHINDFMVLMENYGKAMSYSEEAANSDGQSMEKFANYQESLAGKTEGFKNQFQEFSTTALSSDLFAGVIDGGTGALNIVTQLIGQFGSLTTIMGGVGLVQGLKGGGRRRIISFLQLKMFMLPGSLAVMCTSYV